MDVFTLLELAENKGASDLHLTGSSPPMLRINGVMVPAENGTDLSADAVFQAFIQLTTPEQRETFHRYMELDFARTMRTGVRLRCNASQQRGITSMVIRLLPAAIPTIEGLELPEICKELITKRRGLIVISGPTGSGKSTTLAAMLDYLNKTDRRRVVTIEDPIEYIYSDNKSIFTQRELGTDTLSFAEALRHVLRQDPDVILVGEMRDLETAAAALNVAETGHLVLTTGHAPSASQVIERITDLFPPEERHLAQTRLASLLIGVLCQTLVRRADGAGRIAAIEIMLANTAIRNLIRDSKIYQLPNVIRTHAQMGMKLLDQALVDLYLQQVIKYETVLSFCNDRDEVAKLTGNESYTPESESIDIEEYALEK
ncbi:type IV pilus twitching motility protein PilT [Chloroflexota bacterium]